MRLRMVGLIAAAAIAVGGCGSAAKTGDGGTVAKNDETRDPISGRTASEVVGQARDRAAFLEQSCQKLYGTGWTYSTGAVKNYSASAWSDICWTPVDESEAERIAQAEAARAADDQRRAARDNEMVTVATCVARYGDGWSMFEHRYIADRCKNSADKLLNVERMRRVDAIDAGAFTP